MKKKFTASIDTTKAHRNPRPFIRTALIVVIYLLAFIALDIITKQFQELPGIVAWYPPVGLTYALLLVFGVKFMPAVMVALFVDGLFIYRMPQPPFLLLLWAFILSLIYSLAAVFLRNRIRLDWQLRKLRDVTWLVFTTGFVSALLAVLSVLSSALSSNMPRSEVISSIFHWWIGETVGVLTVAPFLLIHVMPYLKRFAEGQPLGLPSRRSFPRPTLSEIGQVASIALTLYWVFGVRVPGEFHPLYLLALPLIWIALQRGFKGFTTASLALNMGVVLAIWLFRFDLSRLDELELLMIVNCVVGLLMGAVVSERKQAEVQLAQYADQLEEKVAERTRELRDAQEKISRQEKLAVLGQLAGGVGHELRNPLGIINNAIYYLKLVQPEASGKIKQYHAKIEQEVHNAEKIISDLLDFARIKSIKPEPVSVTEMVQRVLIRFPVPPPVKVVKKLPANLPMVFADLRHVEQVLGNLVTNAWQAMVPPDSNPGVPDGGKLTISGRKREGMVAIVVRDTGVGITPENMKKLFEPLFTTKAGGIGLGLAVSRKLAEANGGCIDVESEPGKGSTFTLVLPVHEKG